VNQCNLPAMDCDHVILNSGILAEFSNPVILALAAIS